MLISKQPYVTHLESVPFVADETQRKTYARAFFFFLTKGFSELLIERPILLNVGQIITAEKCIWQGKGNRLKITKGGNKQCCTDAPLNNADSLNNLVIIFTKLKNTVVLSPFLVANSPYEEGFFIRFSVAS